MANNLKDRTGEINKNINGQLMKIIKYNNYSDIVVEFDDKYKTIVKCQYGMFKNGKLGNPNDNTVYNIGRLGQGKYKSKFNKKQTIQYQYWFDMMKRCYSKEYHKRFPTYKGCTVCEEWHNFQNFGKWFDDNFYTIDGEKICLDKDILVKGNKIYSPETCIFVPERINVLFTKNNKIRGKYPIGVSLGNNKKYRATINIFDFVNNKKQSKHLGYFDNIEEAFNIYKKSKENNIKRTADYYKNIIPQKLYEAMYSWEVNIND